MPVTPEGLGELARLLQAVLAGGGVEHQQHLVRRAGNHLLGGAAHLLQLRHQVLFGLQAAGGVDDDVIHAARAGRLQRVEQHGAGIAARALPDHGASPCAAPQISSCSMAAARNVSAAHSSAERPSFRNRCASLPMVVVLPGAVDAHHQDHGRRLGHPRRGALAGLAGFRAGARGSGRAVRRRRSTDAAPRAARMRSRISSVVRTPISAQISVYSSSSSRSASISFLPWMASSSAETRPARVFWTPLLSFSSRDGSCSTEPNSVWIILNLF